MPQHATWSIDVRDDQVRLRFPRHVSSVIAAEAAARAVEAILARTGSAVIVVDMLDVESFAPGAPILAIKAGLPAMGRIRHLELLVRNRMVRIAAVSAARVLGLSCVVRDVR